MPNPLPGGPSDRPHEPPPRTPLADCAIILVRTQGPVNAGMVARLCGNLGVSDLRFVAPEFMIDSSEARKFSTHSRELLLTAPVYADVRAATADCGLAIGTSGDFRTGELGAGLRAEEVPAFLRRRPAAKWALVFGNEADGLNEEELRACQAWIHLDTFGHNFSFNLANAVAICAYVIATTAVREEGRQAASEAPPAAGRAHVADLQRFWLYTLDRFQYFRRAERDRFAPLFEKFIGRLHLTAHDIQVLRGMLAQLHWFAFGDRSDGKGKDAGKDAGKDTGADQARQDDHPPTAGG